MSEQGIKWGKYLQRGVKDKGCHRNGEGGQKQENVLWEPIIHGVLLPAPPTLKLVVLLSLSNFYKNDLPLISLFNVAFLYNERVVLLL